jgi:anti-sigma regulatory factor (Ser/Thr protein kinase)
VITPNLVVEVLLGGSLAVTSGALVAQTRGRRSAVRARHAAEERVAQTEQDAARRLEEVEAAAAGELEALRGQVATNWRCYQDAVDEARHLVGQRLPALVDTEVRRYEGVSVPGLLHPEFKGTDVEEIHAAAEVFVREALETTRAKTGRAARAGVRGMADEAQALLTRLQIRIDEELNRHPAASVYHQSLTDIDHVCTLALHQLQRLRILAGSWPGLQRANATFREIVESARGRIGPYDRVSYTYRPDVGEVYVEGRVVEPVTVALAELMANATAYSSDKVEVYVQQVQVGYLVAVQDAGLGMNPSQRAYAERLLSHRTIMDVTELADERKLGFAVIGRLANDYNFRVDVGSPSASGGVKAVLLVPGSLLGEAPAAAEKVLEARSAHAKSQGPAPDRPQLSTAAGLPKRQPRAASARPSTPTQEALTETADPKALDAGFARMREALSEGYANDSEGRLQ